jgi:hypothetical protein
VVKLHAFLNLALDGLREWSASRFGRFNAGESVYGTCDIAGWGEPRVGMGVVEKEKSMSLSKRNENECKLTISHRSSGVQFERSVLDSRKDKFGYSLQYNSQNDSGIHLASGVHTQVKGGRSVKLYICHGIL